MGEGQPLSSAHQAPLDCSEPMAAQMSLVKLGGSENRIKRHSKEKDLYGGLGRGVVGEEGKAEREKREKSECLIYRSYVVGKYFLKTITLQPQITMCLVG